MVDLRSKICALGWEILILVCVCKARFSPNGCVSGGNVNCIFGLVLIIWFCDWFKGRGNV